MKVILVKIDESADPKIARMLVELVYDEFCFDNHRVYELILGDVKKDVERLDIAKRYNPDYLIVKLKPGRNEKELPDFILENKWQEILIHAWG